MTDLDKPARPEQSGRVFSVIAPLPRRPDDGIICSCRYHLRIYSQRRASVRPCRAPRPHRSGPSHKPKPLSRSPPRSPPRSPLRQRQQRQSPRLPSCLAGRRSPRCQPLSTAARSIRALLRSPKTSSRLRGHRLNRWSTRPGQPSPESSIRRNSREPDRKSTVSLVSQWVGDRGTRTRRRNRCRRPARAPRRLPSPP